MFFRAVSCLSEPSGGEENSLSYNFFATVSRMKYIERWALMRSSRPENLSEHSLEVAMIAHALCTIGNVRYGRHLDADRAALIGIYHDASEIITGDMPTPVKYYNDEIRTAYKSVESVAEDRLISLLPDDLRPTYEKIFRPVTVKSECGGTGDGPEGFGGDSEETPDVRGRETLTEEEKAEAENDAYMRRLVKAADKLSAYIKCIEEENAGNNEFRTAKKTTGQAIRTMAEQYPEVGDFIRDFLPSYGNTLDELSGKGTV